MTFDNWEITAEKTSERTATVTARNIVNVPLVLSLLPEEPKKREAAVTKVTALTSLQANPGEVVELEVTFNALPDVPLAFAFGAEEPAYHTRRVIRVAE